MNQFQKNMASQAGEDTKEMDANNTMSPSEVESSGVVVVSFTPDVLIRQGEEEYIFGLGQLFLKVVTEPEVGMDTD